MARTKVKNYGHKPARPGPKTHLSTDTGPPTGKVGHRQINTTQKAVPLKDALTLAEKLHILDTVVIEYIVIYYAISEPQTCCLLPLLYSCINV